MVRQFAYIGALAAMLAGCGPSRPLFFEASPPQGRFSGQVVWQGTGQPAAGALVLVGETGLAAETDAQGGFAFDAVPLGTYTLVASAPDAQVTTESVILAEGLEPVVHLVLTPGTGGNPAAGTDPEAELRALRAEVRRLRAALRQANRRLVQDTDELGLFERLFLGTEDGACVLHNPEALAFETRGAATPPDVINATAAGLLEVENRRLGYRVLVALRRLTLRRVRRDGSHSMDARAVYSFEPLAPADAREAERWRRNRADAYRGSLRHFLVALAAGRAREEGFTVVARTEVEDSQIYGSSHRYADDIVVDPARYVSPTGQALTHWLSFPETIKVLYEDRTVNNEARVFSGIQPGPQASWLTLAGQAAAFTAYGHLLDTATLNVSGYWGVQQVCTLLPRSYNGE